MTDGALDSKIDHVAVAVPSIDEARFRWQDALGGAPMPLFDAGDFHTRQLRFTGGGKLELLEPNDPDGFAAGFLARFGPGIHHITLKVPDLDVALARLRAAGREPVDVSRTDPHWHESFLRPSTMGGIVVQVAWTPETDEEWASRKGQALPEPAADAATLHGAILRDRDLDVAARRWELLGAQVERDADGLLVVWDGAPLRLRIEQSDDRPGPVAIWMTGTKMLPGDEIHGAPVRGR